MNPGPYMEERRKYLAVASRYEEDCKTNPTPEDLKRCAMASYKAVRRFAPDPEENRALLEVAKSKLEQVLESNRDDHDARFKLGLVIYKLLDLCIIYGEKEFDQYCKEALEHFNTLKAQAPDAYDADYWRKEIESFMPVDECTIEDDVHRELMEILCLQEACEAFKIEHAKDPNNSDILKKWGTALRKLSDYRRTQTRRETSLLAKSRPSSESRSPANSRMSTESRSSAGSRSSAESRSSANSRSSAGSRMSTESRSSANSRSSAASRLSA